jgi:hypothetical protein
MRSSLLFAGLLSLGACAAEAGEDPGKTWKFAQAHADCAPWDGAATSILLSDSAVAPTVAPPYLRISAWIPLPSAEVRADVETSGSGGMSASLCDMGERCVNADRGWVRLTPRDGKIEGHYEIHLADGRMLTGSFTANLATEPRMLCG